MHFEIDEKKVNIIVFICFAVLCSVFINYRVYAVSGDISGDALGTGIYTGPCTGNCSASLDLTPVAFGYRISVVNKKGEFYSGSHSYEYWSNQGTTATSPTIPNGYEYIKTNPNSKYGIKFTYYNEKKPKTYSNKGEKITGKVTYNSSYTEADTLVNGYYPYVDETISSKCYYPNDIAYFPDSLETQCKGHNFTRFAQIEMRNRIDNIKNEKNVDESLKIFIKYLTDCGITANTTQELLSKVKDYYILVEPLAAINRNKEQTTYIGTVNDLYHLGFYDNGNMTNYVYVYWSYANPVVYADSSLGPINGCSAEEAINFDNIGNTLGGTSGCTGVFVVSLGDIFKGSCDTTAKNYISQYKSNKITKKEYINKMKTDDNTKDCMTIVGMNGATPIYKCNVLDPENVDLYDKGYDSSVSSDVCTNYDCTTLAQGVYKKYFYTNNEEYENRIQSFKEYETNNYLHTDFWKAMYNLYGGEEGPKCENKTINCEVTQDKVGNCEENGIRFTDSTKKIDGKECYLSGIAYSSNELFQSSKDESFSNSTCNVYCFETVDFSLPGSPKNINGKEVAAGTVLKWGITNKNNNKFGEMTITRKCHATGNSCNLGSPMEWTKKIDTDVTVFIKTLNGSKKSTVLDTNLVDVTFNGNKPSSISSELSNIKCNSFNGCTNIMKNGGDFVLKAKYDFNYTENSHWYSDKTTADGKPVTNKPDNANYIDIGYGFPIEFTNRAYRYDIYDSENNEYLWGELDTIGGYLYASIKNIGTKNSSGGYHFDNIIKNTSGSDESYVVNGDEYSVRYSCNFATSNPLWDAECFDKYGNKYPLGSEYCKDEEKPKGLDVVFRTVQLINKKTYDTGNKDEIEKELKKAFPGRLGNGRDIGSNWLTISDDESENTKRIFDILSNMVYAQDKPAYHIELNTSKIKYIRKLNKEVRENKLDPYTDKSNYKFDKTKAPDYSYGASDFITNLIEKNWIDGVCASGDKDTRAKNGPCRQS